LFEIAFVMNMNCKNTSNIGHEMKENHRRRMPHLFQRPLWMKRLFVQDVTLDKIHLTIGEKKNTKHL